MNKTILVTGSSSGIGKSSVLYFAARGWNVAATMREEEKDEDFAEVGSIRQYYLDVTDNNSMVSTLEAVRRDFGSIDVLVNNAGYATIGVFEASSEDQVRRQFDVNVHGVMNLCRFAIPIFRAQGYGHIINISSMGGRLTFPLYSAYHATKWAIEGFSESLMYELKPLGIRMSLVEPGLIKTQFTGRSEVRFTKKELNMYDTYSDRVISRYHKSYEHGADPDIVAAKIFKVASKPYRRLRFVIGRPASLLMFLRRVLPEKYYFALIRKSVS